MAQTEAQKDDAVAVIPNTAISPKITAGALSGVVLVVVVAMLSAVTPDMLWWAGRFTPVIYAGVGALIAVGTGYLKKDTSRDFDVPVAALSGYGGVRTDVPAVEAQNIDQEALAQVVSGDTDDMTPQEGTPDGPVTEPADEGVDNLIDATDDQTPPPAGYEPRH